MARRMIISAQEKQTMVRLHKKGFSLGRIAEAVGNVSAGTVRLVLKEQQENGVHTGLHPAFLFRFSKS